MAFGIADAVDTEVYTYVARNEHAKIFVQHAACMMDGL